ncbi:ABC transporter ATP-binding protein/permease [Candidatus Binatia bacterium]|nr:ABC transporter ATP-binding protein/permease [Candidatus Binatia bacterium]
MIDTWLTYLRQGLGRVPTVDPLARRAGRAGAVANLRNLRPFAVRYWKHAAVGSVAVLVASLLGLVPPLVTRYVVDDVILDRRLGLLAGAAAVLIGAKLLEKLAAAVDQFSFARFEQAVLVDIQRALLDRVLRFPKSFFDDEHTGYLMSRLSADVQGLRWFFSRTLVGLLSQFLRLVGSAAFLFYLDWRLAIAALVPLPAMAVGVRYFSRKTRVLSRQSMEQQGNVWRRVQESLSAATLIKALASEARTVKSMTSEWRAAARLALEQSAVGSLAGVAVNLLPEMARVGVLVAGAYWVVQDRWSLGSLLAFISYVGFVYGPVQILAAANLQLQGALAALERVSALFDIVPEENPETGLAVDRLRGEVVFDRVSFSYDRREPVLEDVSFRVGPGEHVGIVGPSGAGKTTLASLILRFYRPTRGEVWFDGRPASDYRLDALRRRIGYVQQSPLLLSGTVMDNLRYGHPDAAAEEVLRAARVAGIHEFIAGLPRGYDSTVGERGINFSEGQRQRLALARALIGDPDILVLDEPTSALDARTEHSIFAALPSLVREKTVFVVTHRLATVRRADWVLVLNDGRLEACGAHAELIESSAVYSALIYEFRV